MTPYNIQKDNQNVYPVITVEVEHLRIHVITLGDIICIWWIDLEVV